MALEHTNSQIAQSEIENWNLQQCSIEAAWEAFQKKNPNATPEEFAKDLVDAMEEIGEIVNKLRDYA